MIEWDGIEDSIKISKNPFMLLTYIFIHKNMLDDENLCLVIRYMMKYHFNLFFKKDIRKTLYLLKDYNLSQNVINDFYKNLIKQKELIDKIKKFKSGYNKSFFWNKTLREQIIYLNFIRNKFNSYNDCSIGHLHFHKKIKLVESEDKVGIIINEDEIFDRLLLIKKLLGIRFFFVYNVNLMSYEDYYESDYTLKCKYMEYIYLQINKIIDETIDTFTLLECVKEQMKSLINPVPIKIEVGIFTSEMEDIDF